MLEAECEKIDIIDREVSCSQDEIQRQIGKTAVILHPCKTLFFDRENDPTVF
jgi:hypothetical protein